MNVVAPIVYPVEYGMTPPQLPELESEARRNAEEALDRLLDETVGEGVEVERRVVVGLPSKTLCDIARDEGIDLIVMATRGLSGLPHLLLGSTAERVVRTAPCPVLDGQERSLTPVPDAARCPLCCEGWRDDERSRLRWPVQM